MASQIAVANEFNGKNYIEVSLKCAKCGLACLEWTHHTVSHNPEVVGSDPIFYM